MTSILIIDNSGTIKESVVKKYDEEMLYKKAGLKLVKDFKLQHTFTVPFKNETYSVSLFGRTNWKSSTVNKYDFPPPIDNILYYGNCILVMNDIITMKPCDLSIKLWESLYSVLFNGFEDIEDSEGDDNEIESIDPLLLTKDGYLKDDFVTEDTSDDDYISEEEKPVKKTKKVATIKKKITQKKNLSKTEDDIYLGCVSELTSEEYFT